MKIISKYKDYYDYLQGIYGIDEKLVLDRTSFCKIPYVPSNWIIDVLYVGEYQIEGLWMDGKVLYGEEIKPFISSDNAFYTPFTEDGVTTDSHYKLKDSKYYYSHSYILKKPKYLGEKSPTWKEDCPILIEGPKNGYSHNPILSEYNIQKVFKPEEIWNILSEWLSKRITKNEKSVPIGDDKVRILSAGFDLKTSFRNIK